LGNIAHRDGRYDEAVEVSERLRELGWGSPGESPLPSDAASLARMMVPAGGFSFMAFSPYTAKPAVDLPSPLDDFRPVSDGTLGEPPAGDWMRGIGVRHGAETSHSANYNRGKKSVVLNLKDPKALAAARALVDRADVFIENFRPGAVARLGLGYDAVKETNPGLVYLSISGFGQTGPYRGRPCTDTVAQAFSGMMTMNRAMDDTPVKASVFLIDAITGLYGFQAVSMALFGRRESGAGRYLDVSLMQSIAAIMSPHIADFYLQGGAPRLPNVPGGVYQTKDGYILVTLLNERQYQSICGVVGMPQLAEDERFDSFDRRAVKAIARNVP